MYYRSLSYAPSTYQQGVILLLSAKYPQDLLHLLFSAYDSLEGFYRSEVLGKPLSRLLSVLRFTYSDK